MVTLRVPAPSSQLLANLLGLLGLLGAAVAVGGITDNWWWTLAVASAEAVFLSVVASTKLGEDAESGVPEVPGAELAAVRPRTA